MAEQLSTHRHPIKLRGPGGIPLPVIGALKVTMRYQNREIVETVYVLRNQSTSLLNKATCVSLKIISRVDEISGSATPNFGAEFHKTIYGTWQTEYRLPHHTAASGHTILSHYSKKSSPPLASEG